MNSIVKTLVMAGVAAAALVWSASANAQSAAVKSEPYFWATAPIGGGGFVDGFVYHPAEKGLLYSRTDIGGAYRWDTATRSWFPLLDGMARGEDLGVLSLALDAQDPDKVFIATGLYSQSWAAPAVVWRSDDRGLTWQRSELSVKLGGNEEGRATGERLQVDPNNGNILFLGTTADGLLKSSDGAKTWSSVAAFPEKAINFVLFDPRSGKAGSSTQTIYVGTNTKDHNLYVSHDAGGTWQVVAGTPRTFIANHAAFDANGATLYVTFSLASGPAGCDDGAVSKFDLATQQWKDITPARPGNGSPSFCYAGVSTAASVPGTVIVTEADRWWNGGDTIFRSTDGGAHWTDLGALSTHTNELFPWVTVDVGDKALPGHWIFDAQINPFNPNEAIYGTGGGLWMTENLTDADQKKTVTWSLNMENFEETAAMDMVSPSAGAHLLVAMGDVGGYRFADFDASPSLDGGYFQPPAGTNRSVDFAELNPGFVVRVADGDQATNHAFYSRDNGKTWADMPSKPPLITHDDKGWYSPGRIAVSANGTSMVWTTGKGDAYYSTDRGKTWAASVGYPLVPGRSFAPFSDRATDGVYYVYSGETGEMSISIDNGATFKVFAKGLPVLESWRHAAQSRAVPGRPRDIWLPSPQGLFHSADAKSSFRLLPDISDALGVGFGMAAEGASYPAVYFWGHYKGVLGIFRSIDEGKSWVRINDDAHQYGSSGMVIGDPQVFGLVYISTAGRGVVIGIPDSGVGGDQKSATQ